MAHNETVMYPVPLCAFPLTCSLTFALGALPDVQEALVGWVRNLEDGTVEALLQGPHDEIDKLLSWMHVGPPSAHVSEVQVTEVHDDRRYDRFEQL